jgi:hypothetical protein
MQTKPVPSPLNQPALPLEIPRRAGPPRGAKEAVVDRCAPKEAWQTLDAPGRDRLHRTWLCVLKEVVGDAQNL